MNNLVNLRGIGKTYHMGKIGYEALKEIDLDIAAGEYVAILGPSGSGKSTLMQIIGCLSTPTVGSYLLNGEEVGRLGENALARVRNRTVGFVFQNFNLLSQLTVLENVALPLFYRGVGFVERNKSATEILEKLGLTPYLKHGANELSGGQQQRVAIARALVTNPEIILADEPTGNLDSNSGADVIAILAELSRAGKTVITVTHDVKLAEHAKRVVYIYDGKIKVGNDKLEKVI